MSIVLCIRQLLGYTVNRTPNVLTDDIRSFHQSLPACDKIFPTADHDRMLSCPYRFIIHLPSRLFYLRIWATDSPVLRPQTQQQIINNVVYSVLTQPVAYRGGKGLGGSTPLLPKFRSFDKAQPNSQFCGKYMFHPFAN
jgi:hypothetical protein